PETLHKPKLGRPDLNLSLISNGKFFTIFYASETKFSWSALLLSALNYLSSFYCGEIYGFKPVRACIPNVVSADRFIFVETFMSYFMVVTIR
ncbi:MAG: hypothetical protein QXL59_04150, partial [Candidatus Jordarchaeales archaeon]